MRTGAIGRLAVLLAVVASPVPGNAVIERVSVDSAGTQGNAISFEPDDLARRPLRGLLERRQQPGGG